MRRLRANVRRQRRREDGAHTIALGVRAGYWPCLGAPFFRVDLGPCIFEVWFGRPSYLPWESG